MCSGEFGQEVEGLEDIEVAGGVAEEVCAGRFGEAMGSLLFGAVDDLAGAGDAQNACEAEGAAGHVLGEALNPLATAGGQADTAIDAEAAVLP